MGKDEQCNLFPCLKVNIFLSIYIFLLHLTYSKSDMLELARKAVGSYLILCIYFILFYAFIFFYFMLTDVQLC